MSEAETPSDTSPDVPPEDANPAKTDLPPDQALALLREGKPVQNARIKGLKFRGVFDKPVLFRNCTLVRTSFDGVEFADAVAFVGCTLDRPSFNRATVFRGNLDIGNSVLNKVQFARLMVRGDLNATNAEFRGKLGFTHCTFEKKVSFWEAKFHCWSDFKNCTFRGEADFRSIHAGEGFVLTKSTFHENFLFRGSNVAKKFQADGCTFEKLLDLSKAKLHDFCYLEGIVQGAGQRFAFLNAIAKLILVKPEQIEGRLASEESGDFATAMQEYGLLKKCYQEQHRFDQEDWAFYRFKVNQRKSKSWSWKKPWTQWRHLGDWLFLDIGCGYGTNPLRAVRMASVIIASFAALYALNVESFYTEKMPFPGDKTDPENRLMIGLITSVSVFTSGMGGIRELAQGWMNVPVMVESIMGTLLFGLFIVAFSRKVIR